jgi:4-diphosphocytidyl-2-C-methyl-D-erythritol kinase
MNKNIECFGKVNLGLDVYKSYPKKSNYHKIETIMIVYREFSDIMTISETFEDFSVTYEDTHGNVIDIENDSITKAYEYFQNYFKLKQNYTVKVVKSIPMGSGFGGAASNAASFMNYVAEENDFELTKEGTMFKDSDYHKIVFEVGSDVPFFLSGDDIAHVSGFGEIIEKIPSYNVPTFSVIGSNVTTSSSEIYGEFDDLALKVKSSNYKKIISKLPLVQVKYVQNNLQNPAFSKHVGIKNLYDSLDQNEKDRTFLNASGGYFVRFE